jgi:hypothetical protein
MTSAVYQPTASQWAAAAMHLDRRDEWRYFRSAGVRYVSIISGQSNRLWIARADADGCGCPWSQKTFTPCSHRIALELDALEADLIEARNEDIDGEVDLAFAALATSKRGDGAGAALIRRYEDLWPEED